MEDFQSDSGPAANAAPNYDPPTREPVRLIAVSSQQGVVNMIHLLHLRGAINADEWSPLQPEPMTGKWMSVATKYVQSG
jgi:hypothetical protein